MLHLDGINLDKPKFRFIVTKIRHKRFENYQAKIIKKKFERELVSQDLLVVFQILHASLQLVLQM